MKVPEVDKILAEIEQLSQNLHQLIMSFDETTFNHRFSEGRWSAGQISEHLLLAVGAGLLLGNVKTTTRDPAEKIPLIRSVFLDFETKMQSPDFILPSGRFMEVGATAKAMRDSWDAIARAVQQLDLCMICTDFVIPGFGEMSRLEWVHLFICHTQRHQYQMNQLKQAVVF